jgi:putative tryptophan/tyrosine transport system substrate-binding protein
MRASIDRVYGDCRPADSRGGKTAVWLCTVWSIVTLTLSLLVTPNVATTQPRETIPLVGVLSPATPQPASPAGRSLTAFRQSLRELGYVEGQTIRLAYRYAAYQWDRLPALAAEPVQLQPDVIVTNTGAGVRAAQQATATIPIVVAIGPDLVDLGLVASLARPGGNITGLSSRAPEVSGKRLEILKEAGPHLSRVAALWHRDAPVGPYLTETQAAAQALGLQLQALEVGSSDAFAQAFAAMTRAHAEALVVIPSAQISSHQRVVAELAMTHRLPTMFGQREDAAAGGLMSYGPKYAEFYRRAATYVDKILKGAKPADLPVEQPMKFELVINLKTAQALGITMPPTVLFQADEVIK